MSDFSNLCNTFDKMELKYTKNKLPNKKQIIIKETDKVEQIGMNPDCILWFEFDIGGKFEKLYVEE